MAQLQAWPPGKGLGQPGAIPRVSQMALVVKKKKKKNMPANAGDERDMGLISGSGRSLGEGDGNPLQDSCLENAMGRGAWQPTVHGVTRSPTWLSMSTSASGTNRRWGVGFSPSFSAPHNYDIRECSNFTLLHVAVQFSQHHLLKSLFPIAYSCLLCHVNWP